MTETRPKPEDPEIVAAKKICQEMRDVAKKLPRPMGNEAVGQFENNFYFLFLAILNQREGKTDELTQPRLKKAEEKYGVKWEKFLTENADLLYKIQSVLEEQKLYRKLNDHFVVLYLKPKTRELATQINIELNLDGIQADIWNKLNPLLEEVAASMKKYDISPEDFYDPFNSN